MGKALATMLQHEDRDKHKAGKPKRTPEQRRALNNMRKEARAAGAVLQNNGEGGLPPDLVLGVMRRDGYECKVHGDRGEGENGGLTVHHKGGIVESEWLSKKGHSMTPNNIVTLCARAHDDIHDKARAEGEDSSQVTPEGDRGTKRDHGKPLAHPEK